MWTYNLTAANLIGDAKKPTWYRQTNLREDFNLKDLSPASLNDLIQRMLKDPMLFDKVKKTKCKF